MLLWVQPPRVRQPSSCCLQTNCFCWKDIPSVTPKTKPRFSDSLSEIIDFWLCILKKMVFCYWYHAGIKQISNIFDSWGAIFSCSIKYSFLSIFNIKRVFLILALFVLIPPNWKKLFKEDSFDPVSLPISIHSLTCRIIYSLLLNHEDQPPPTSEEKRRASGVAKKALAKI